MEYTFVQTEHATDGMRVVRVAQGHSIINYKRIRIEMPFMWMEVEIK